MQTVESAVQPGRIVIPERTPELEARQILFAARPMCDHCKKTVTNIDDVTAVIFFGANVWKLLHRDGCVVTAVLFGSANSSRGISASSYRRRFVSMKAAQYVEPPAIDGETRAPHSGLTAQNMAADLERWESEMKPAIPSCPKCAGEMWANQFRRNDRAPDFICTDRSCGGVIWPSARRTD